MVVLCGIAMWLQADVQRPVGWVSLLSDEMRKDISRFFVQIVLPGLLPVGDFIFHRRNVESV